MLLVLVEVMNNSLIGCLGQILSPTFSQANIHPSFHTHAI